MAEAAGVIAAAIAPWVFGAFALGAGVAIFAAARRDGVAALAAFAAAQACAAGVAAASGANTAAFALASLGLGWSTVIVAFASLQPFSQRDDGLRAGPLAVLAPGVFMVFGLMASAQVAPFSAARATHLAPTDSTVLLIGAALALLIAFVAPPVEKPDARDGDGDGVPAAAVAASVPLTAVLVVAGVWLGGGGVLVAIGAGAALAMAFCLYAMAFGVAVAQRAAPAPALKALCLVGVVGIAGDGIGRAAFQVGLRPEATAACFALVFAAALLLAFFGVAQAAQERAR